MCADTDQQSYEGHGSETDPQLGGITSACECRAKVAIFLLTVVHHTHREWPAFVIDVFEAAVFDYFEVATFHQTIADSGLNALDNFWVCYDKPSMKRGVRLECM